MTELKIDPMLLRCVISGTIEGLAMTQAKPEPIGASRYLTSRREVSVLVSLYGDQNGTMTLNMGKGTATWLASRLLGEDVLDLDESCLDAVCELGNMVSGRFKEQLRGTGYQFTAISTPALVLGSNYQVRYHRGIVSAGVEFEIVDMPMVRMRDRYFGSSISMMRK